MASVHVSDNVGGHSNLGRDQFRDRDWCATCRRRDWCPRYTTVQKSGRRWCQSYEYKNKVIARTEGKGNED